jgi:hypothetical protein
MRFITILCVLSMAGACPRPADAPMADDTSPAGETAPTTDIPETTQPPAGTTPPEDEDTMSRRAQLESLQTKQILVPMWGWPAEEMAQAAKSFGYEVVNAPHGNDLEVHAREAAIWAEAGLQMIVRPILQVADPFDSEDVARGIAELEQVVAFHNDNPAVLGFVIAWGLYGEGGFPIPEGYTFTEKARAAFNERMGTPDAPLPEEPADGQPGSLRYVQWLEYRSEVLREFRRTFVAAVKEKTGKLVGTWSEFYPIENYYLNMGDAPGADFLFYDLSFGDVTTDQTRAFAETHGNMQHYETFGEWRDHELPLMAKSAGEGVIPVGFQFPMRRGHATDFLAETTVFIDHIEDEYSLRIGPDIRKLVDTVRRRTWEPEVAVVYHSFAGAVLPGGNDRWFYQNSVRQIEGAMRQMGVAVKVIPHEALAWEDLSAFKLVVVPDPMYLNPAMRDNLAKAARVLYSGEFLLTHRDPDSEEGNFWAPEGFRAVTRADGRAYRYLPAEGGPVVVEFPEHPWMAGVAFDASHPYPADQMVVFDPLPADAEVLLSVGGRPVLFATEGGRVVHAANRMFNHAWRADDDRFERPMSLFLRNLLADSGVTLRVTSPPAARVKEGFPYGSYGLTGPIAWNATATPVDITLADGRSVTIPPNGWTEVDPMLP